MEHSVKLKIATKRKAPSDEGAGFLQSKKTEGEIPAFLSFHRKRSPFLIRGRQKRRCYSAPPFCVLVGTGVLDCPLD